MDSVPSAAAGVHNHQCEIPECKRWESFNGVLPFTTVPTLTKSISRSEGITQVHSIWWEKMWNDCDVNSEAEKYKRNLLSASSWSSSVTPCCSPCTGWWPCLASSCDSRCMAMVLAICKTIIIIILNITIIFIIFHNLISGTSCIWHTSSSSSTSKLPT